MIPKTHLISNNKSNQNDRVFVESIIYLLVATRDGVNFTHCEFYTILLYTLAITKNFVGLLYIIDSS